MIGSYIYYRRTERAGWQFAVVTQVVEGVAGRENSHTIKLLDMGRRINVKLKEENLTTDNLVQDAGTWCWHVHVTGKDANRYLYTLQQ